MTSFDLPLTGREAEWYMEPDPIDVEEAWNVEHYGNTYVMCHDCGHCVIDDDGDTVCELHDFLIDEDESRPYVMCECDDWF